MCPVPSMATLSAASGQVEHNGKSHIVPVNGGPLLSPANGTNNMTANGAGEVRGATFLWKYCNSFKNHLMTGESFRSQSQRVECQKERIELNC